ncbi:hypothetical protein [Streptomyces sp. ODS28]|uniref:hypothetical protein n=1 Tax=Streptomyces sp. ODS28 TaxID=3136688 RepID=UPI0031E55DB0
MATANPNDERPQHGPPAVGKRASVRVDENLHADLVALMRCGITASDAIRDAVALLADIHRAAWDMGGYPEGAPPVIQSANLAAYDTVRRTDQHV